LKNQSKINQLTNQNASYFQPIFWNQSINQNASDFQPIIYENQSIKTMNTRF